MQTEFVERVAKHHGLERGIKHSKARHQTIRQFYGNLEAAERYEITVDPVQAQPQILKEGIFRKAKESPEMLAKRLSQEITESHRDMLNQAVISAQARQRAKNLQETAREQQKRIETLSGPFEGLSKSQVAEVLKMAVDMQRENQATRRRPPPEHDLDLER